MKTSNISRLSWCLPLVAGICLGIAPGAVSAQSQFPGDRPVTIVVPFSAGGPTDKVARELAQAMSKPLGQTIVVENVTGAGGTIGTRKVASAQKDGYTVLVHTLGMSTAPSLYRNLPFDPESDFAYVGQIVDMPMVIVGRKGLPAKDLKELVAHIRANEGKVTIGHAGPGSAAHLCTLLFEREVKAKMISVPYKGSAPALSDVMGGQIDLACDQTSSTSAQILGGQVVGYAIATGQRHPGLPNLHTAREQGLEGFDMKTWHGMYAPRGTPEAVIQRISSALRATLADPTFARRMSELGGQVVAPEDATSDSLRKKVSSDIVRWREVIGRSGLKPQ